MSFCFFLRVCVTRLWVSSNHSSDSTSNRDNTASTPKHIFALLNYERRGQRQLSAAYRNVVAHVEANYSIPSDLEVRGKSKMFSARAGIPLAIY